MAVPKKILFCFFYQDYREFEWFEPYLRTLRGVANITAILPVTAQASRQKSILNKLEQLGVETTLMPSLTWSRNAASDRFRWGGPYVLRQLWNPESFLHRRFPVLRQLFQANWAYFVADFDVIFFTNGRDQKETKGKYTSLCLTAARLQGVPYVSIPFSGLSMLSGHPTAQRVSRFDFDPGLRRHFCRASVSVGAVRFRDAAHSNFSKGIRPAVVTLALKNRSSWLKDLLNQKEHDDLREKIARTLIDKGFTLLVKPHPGIPDSEVEALMDKLPADQTELCYCSLTELAEKSQAVVFEFISSGMFEVIAAGIPTYWPADELAAASGITTRNELLSDLHQKGMPKDYARVPRLNYPDFNKIDALNEAECAVLDKVTGGKAAKQLTIPDVLKCVKVL